MSNQRQLRSNLSARCAWGQLTCTFRLAVCRKSLPQCSHVWSYRRQYFYSKCVGRVQVLSLSLATYNLSTHHSISTLKAKYHNLVSYTFKWRVVAFIPHCVCLSVGPSVCRSKNLKIGIMSISCLNPNYLSTVMPQTIINELLAGTVPLKNHLPELF